MTASRSVRIHPEGHRINLPKPGQVTAEAGCAADEQEHVALPEQERSEPKVRPPRPLHELLSYEEYEEIPFTD